MYRQLRLECSYLRCLQVHFLLLAAFTSAIAQNKLDTDKVRATPSYNLLAKKNWLHDLEAIQDIASEDPREFIEALLVYTTFDEPRAIVDIHLNGFDFLLMARHDQFRRVLIQYLSFAPNGQLERYADPTEPLRTLPKGSVAARAYYLLRLIDSIADSPWQTPELLVPPEWRRRDYHFIVTDYKANVPKELIEYLFEEFPEEAWGYFMGAERIGPVGVAQSIESTKLSPQDFEWAAHVIQTTAWRMQRGYKQFAETKLAQEQIERLANDPAWYSRRYVVHVLLKYPFFRTPELVKRLQEDKHPLVRDRAKFIKLEPAEKQ